jgi:acyl-CoA dehydrogenase
MDKRGLEILDGVGRFAEREVATREGLSRADVFPTDLWKKMAGAGLLGLSIPEQFGGTGGHYGSAVLALKAFAQSGRNMGMALSWMIHLLVARFFILSFGREEQAEAYLRPMAKGDITGSIAISEPGTGAHPKHLKTTARIIDDGYEVSGEKTYLTNGTFADFFMVFSVTGLSGNHKAFTFIIVPRDTKGLQPGPLMKIDFLRPSPHCGVRLDRCRVPLSNQLGEGGTAYERMSKPFRPLEDVLLMGPLLGGMAWQLEALLGVVRKKGHRDREGLKEKLGLLQVSLDTIEVMAGEAAKLCDGGLDPERLDVLTVALKVQSKNHQALVDAVASGIGVAEDPEFGMITHDLRKTIGLADQVAQIKTRNIGERLLSKG